MAIAFLAKRFQSMMFYAISVIVLLLLAFATFCDFRTREIPDWISIAIALVAIVSSAMGYLGLSLPLALTGGVLGLLVGYLLFRYAQLGGGDAKLIAALGLVVGPVGILIVLFGMALAGGVLSLVAMLRGQRDYAYVPAITVGFVGYIGLVSQI